MTTRSFRVWAPDAADLHLDLGGLRHQMEQDQSGWWECAIDGIDAGALYSFCVDGGDPLPDPRSPSQPLGVHGPSAVIDHQRFRWTDAGWRGLSLRGSVIYEAHIGTFTPGGTFEAAIERLDDLVELGIDAIELMPVAEFAGERGWGYDGVSLFAPHHSYGGPEGLKRFVDACHQRGIGVVIDVVYNHTGPAGSYLAEFGPYFTDRYSTAWGAAVNFDGPGSHDVRRFVIDNALMWLRDYHCDGLRLDAVHAIFDQSATHILEEITEEVGALASHARKPLFVIAESDLNDPRLVSPTGAGGYGLDAAWADDWHHAMHAVMTGEKSGYYADFGTMSALASTLEKAWVYDGRWSEFRQRVHGRKSNTTHGTRFVVCTQNHDQVGNRALGERLSQLVGMRRLKVAAALLLTGPFTPMVFQGEEWAADSPFQYFTDHDEELGALVRNGRVREFAGFGWDPAQIPDPQDRATFDRSRLDWCERSQLEHAEMLQWYRALIKARRTIPGLSDPRLELHSVSFCEDPQWLLIRRPGCLLAATLSDTPCTVPAYGATLPLLTSDPFVRVVEGGLHMPPESVALVKNRG